MFTPVRKTPPWVHPTITTLSFIALASGVLTIHQQLFSNLEKSKEAQQREEYVAQKIADSEALQSINEAAIENGISYQTTIKLNTDGCSLPGFDSSRMTTVYADGTHSEPFQILHPHGLDEVEVTNTNNFRIGSYSLKAKRMTQYFPPINCTETSSDDSN